MQHDRCPVPDLSSMLPMSHAARLLVLEPVPPPMGDGHTEWAVKNERRCTLDRSCMGPSIGGMCGGPSVECNGHGGECEAQDVCGRVEGMA